MKMISKLRFAASFVVVFAMLSPVAVLAMADGRKHFKEGMKHEVAELWDKAVEEFALAVAEKPKNPEYKLHLQRALFMASQMYMKKGTELAKEKDYAGGYNAFRRAYAYDPTNELAKAEMDRMVRLQSGDSSAGGERDSNGNVKLVQTSYKKPVLPQRLEKLRDVPFPGGVDLQFIIKELAKELDLNILFDSQSFRTARTTKIDLRNVSAAQALDYIFLQENLFFQKVGPRTVLVADSQTRRAVFQQMVLRTFYLSNADPTKIKPLIQQAIPVQPGRSQTIVMEDAATNSITVRDTEENIRLIGNLIRSLDKDRAEVVMDVAIYEVNKSDLMEFGNQIGTTGTDGTLRNLGGVGFPLVRAGSTTGPITSKMPFQGLPSTALALGLPVSNIVALQNKSNTKLIASTQIHAFNNEDSSARIGQRVPVKTATFQTGNTTGNSVVSDVINYEQVGLTLKFKPLVFPNQDVQVAMEIESKDVVASNLPLIPTFTERTVKGTARVQNNKTLLLASVASGVQSKGTQGLPLLGLIPIIGRLFSVATHDSRQVDIVIAITPKVIRAPSILPEDEIERPTGSQATPTNSSLEAMIIREEEEENIASARRAPTNTNVQLPDQPNVAPAYVRTGAVDAAPQTNNTAAIAPSVDPSILKPIDTSAKTLDIKQTSDTSPAPIPAAEAPKPTLQPTEPADPRSNAPKAGIRFGSDLPEMKVGDKAKVAIYVEGSVPFRSAVLGLKFDDKKLAIRSVKFGDVFGTKLMNVSATPFLNQGGKMYVSLSTADTAVGTASGIIAYIEIEALSEGKPDITFDKDVLNILTSDGKNFSVSF